MPNREAIARAAAEKILAYLKEQGAPTPPRYKSKILEIISAHFDPAGLAEWLMVTHGFIITKDESVRHTHECLDVIDVAAAIQTYLDGGRE